MALDVRSNPVYVMLAAEMPGVWDWSDAPGVQAWSGAAFSHTRSNLTHRTLGGEIEKSHELFNFITYLNIKEIKFKYLMDLIIM